MKRHFKKLSVALIGVIMVVALCLGMFSGCGKKYDLSVYIFAGEADQVTNGQLIRAWERQYAEKLKAQDPEKFGEDFTITVDDTYEAVTETYFQNLETAIASGSAQDVFYVSPKYVKSYAATNSVLDLTDYIEWDNYDPNGLWASALGAYAYDSESGTIGEAVTYTSNGSEGAGFYTESGDKAGLYALPKDFSSFGLAYNRNFFSTALKNAYTTTKDTRGAVYSVDASGEQGGQTNIINIGVTTRYYPFNFYKYDTYTQARDAGDPIAAAANANGGYDVTILGWPGDTYKTGATDDPSTSYDESIGYVTYTYAEYSAMAWAICYYAERYDIANPNTSGATTGSVRQGHKLMTWLNDTGRPAGTELNGTNYVYGNDQYESTLYLTAWLLGNDVDIISEDYKSVTAPEGQEATSDYGIYSDKYKEAYAAFLAFGSDWNANSYFAGSGEADGTRGGWPTFNAGRCVFYGIGTWDLATFNSADPSVLEVGIMPEPIAESFSPYARVKDANYNSKTYGTTPVTDASTYDAYDENWAISDNIATTNATWFGKQQERQNQWAARLDTVGYGVNADVLTRYTGDDEWKVAAMADLCAYLAMDETMQQALTYAGSQLTTFVDQGEDYLYYQTRDNGSFEFMITPDGTSAGNVINATAAEVTKLKTNRPPNTVVEDENGDEVTIVHETYLPASFPDGGGALSGEEAFQFASAVASMMTGQQADSSVRNLTITQYIDQNFPSLKAYVNTYFKDSTISQCENKSYAFKCLNLVALRYEDRNLQLRMASGANGALDSCMYTYTAEWINDIGDQKGKFLIAWEATRSVGGYSYSVWADNDTSNDKIPTTINAANYTAPTPGNNPSADGKGTWSGGKFYTPAAFCDWQVIRSQNLLNQAIQEEEAMLG